MKRFLAFGLMVPLILAGCGKQNPALKVTYVPDDDPRMNAAMAEARSNVNDFIAALQTPVPGQGSFSVKMAFKDGKNGEHMWLSPVSYDGQRSMAPSTMSQRRSRRSGWGRK